MADPIQRDKSLLERIRNTRLEAWRQFSIWLMFGGVLLYIFGEIGASELAVLFGIWLLLAGIAGALLCRLLTDFSVFSKQDE
jgi:uncharacterized membrane protein HdeD (DUF308 family)